MAVISVYGTGAVGAMGELADFLRLPLDAVEGYDVAALNLRCARGLPGAEDLDEGRILGWLDGAARAVHLETRRHWYRFAEAPGRYHNSAGFFCCYLLLQTLQEDLGVRYNPARIRDPKFQDPKCFDPDFSDSRDLFIHGLVDGPGGTCASMPVLYVAVGRRLGYPLRLVQTRGHLFVRWDDPHGRCFGVPERFNVEGSGEGIACYDDEHYRAWPEPWTEADEAGGWYLKSMSPREELAAFLATRGDCLADNGRLPEAVEAYRWASAAAPHDLRYRHVLARTHQHQLARQEQDMALLLEMSQRTRESHERRLAGPVGKASPLTPASSIAQRAGSHTQTVRFHEAIARYNRDLMEWNQLNQTGRARGTPPRPPRPGTEYEP